MLIVNRLTEVSVASKATASSEVFRALHLRDWLQLFFQVC